MKPSHRRPGFRFTFFQRQFLSHLLLSMLILVLLAAGFTYYMKQRTFDNETEELASVSKGIVRLLAKDGEDPTSALQAFRTLLASAERRSSCWTKPAKSPTAIRKCPARCGARRFWTSCGHVCPTPGIA